MEHFYHSINEIISGARRYVVPPYQRSYKWEGDNVNELLEDVKESGERKNKEYFIGNIIICRTEKNDETSLEIVDGQQRLITITLIMLELSRQIKDEDVKKDLESRIFSYSIVTGYRAPVITLQERDREFYSECMIKNDELPKKLTETQKQFVENRQKIRDFVSNLGGEENRIDFVRHLMGRVFVLELISEDIHASFRLFNVLNNRGMPLSYTDLLKSDFIGKREKSADLWRKLEDTVKEIDAQGKENSLEVFLTARQISEKPKLDRVKKNIYEYYSGKLKGDYKDDSEEMCRHILSSAEKFRDIFYKNSNIYGTTSFLLDGFSKQITEWSPAIMAFINNGLDEQKFPEFAGLLEKIYMQQWLIGSAKSTREKASYYALVAINNKKSYSEILQDILQFEDNKSFEKSLDRIDFYDETRPNKINLVKRVLLKLNQGDGDKDVEMALDGNITVEHILPKSKTDPYWNSRFNNESHKEWLNKLGNLTLIGRRGNSAGKNYEFDRKKKEYKDSKFQLTKQLCDDKKWKEWNESNLEKRHEELKNKLKELWLIKRPIL